jgi:iron(III) transport system ATP-binding protein
VIAGLEEPSAGHVFIDDEDVTDRPPHARDIIMVFQSYALFPHLTVFENVAYGLRVLRRPADEVRRRVTETLALTGIGDFAARPPASLSGGQQQRVALARALVLQPKVILFDEPLSNLDAKLRKRMRDEIRGLQRRVGIPAIYVTHDQAEALAISDRIAVMPVGASSSSIRRPRSTASWNADRRVWGPGSGRSGCSFLRGRCRPAPRLSLRGRKPSRSAARRRPQCRWSAGG